ncbi:twitching motility protein PilT [Mycolicibacter kumamotonensis]|uniref:Twitching motility protein PilT n=1 Tax=Mycolicibacter kumamotonensis TaxID=354243 RepID=A0A1B8SDX2_9MYCO|nr:twitching motility protein PilT [Mycolicibacter kumamotonensis]OBY30925.1 twitching motility protein PilT [Mycolicibacter kumamotonensis]
MSEPTSGLLDTPVVIDWHDPKVVAALPDEVAISAITAAELAAGPLLATSAVEAARRQARLDFAGLNDLIRVVAV